MIMAQPETRTQSRRVVRDPVAESDRLTNRLKLANLQMCGRASHVVLSHGERRGPIA